MDSAENTMDGPPPKAKKKSRVRTDLTPFKAILEDLWRRGMTNKTDPPAKVLIEEAVSKTNLGEGIIERWIRNRRQKAVRSSKPAQPYRRRNAFLPKKKATSGYDVFRRDFFKGKTGQFVTGDAGSAWTNLSSDEKSDFNRKAKIEELEPRDPPSDEERQRGVTALYKQMRGTMTSLNEAGCDLLLLGYHHQSKKSYQSGTPAGRAFLQENEDLEWNFSSSVSKSKNGNQMDQKMLVEKAIELLNQKWQMSSGKGTRFRYGDYEKGLVKVEGLPEGFILKKPGKLKMDQLKQLLACKDKILVKVLSKETAGDGPSHTVSTPPAETDMDVTTQDEQPPLPSQMTGTPSVVAPAPAEEAISSKAKRTPTASERLEDLSMESEDEIYNVECFLEKRKLRYKGVEFLVKWSGFDRSTWETRKRLVEDLGRATVNSLEKGIKPNGAHRAGQV
ncbi:Hypp9644 [Branchiostoma lanceolatum]|uniref:Hypp9644 protein n=2 Tax=Branchiostoma lanceolatum TaxID=7740 RepID=A0A8S4MNW4_BRALA|nr:Hypp9644 [Branchiostoma lanceolatum]